MNKKEVFAVLIGAFIMLIPFLLLLKELNPDNVINYFNNVITDSSAFLWMIGGFATAFIAEKNIKGGILTGFLAALISNITIFILYSSIFGALTFAVIFFIVLVGLFAITGGLIGGLVNKWRFKTINKEKLIVTSFFALCLSILFLLFLIPSPSNDNYLDLLIFLTIMLPVLVLSMFYKKMLESMKK